MKLIAYHVGKSATLASHSRPILDCEAASSTPGQVVHTSDSDFGQWALGIGHSTFYISSLTREARSI
jgi:hypothetical protein